MKNIMHILIFVITFIQCYGCTSSTQITAKEETPNDTLQSVKDTKLKITIGDKTATAIFYDNPTARDFVAQLPLIIDMDDFGGHEKIFYPPKKLSTAERKAVSDPKVGDINVYAPWGNIAIFYTSYSGSNDLIRIGRITEGVDIFKVSGTIKKVKFEIVE